MTRRFLSAALVAAALLGLALAPVEAQRASGVANLSTATGTVAVAHGGTGGTTGRAAGSNLSLPYILSNTSTSASHTGDTNETVLGWVNVPANSLGANGCINLDEVWKVTGSANTWILTIRVITGTSNGTLAGTAMVGDTVTAGVGGRAQHLICNNNATNSQFEYNNAVSTFTGSTNGLGTAAIDTTAAWTVSVNAKVSTGTDSIALRHLHSEIIATAGN